VDRTLDVLLNIVGKTRTQCQEAVTDLKALTSLNLNNQNITDIAPIVELKGLLELKLNGNQIDDLSVVNQLTNLERFEMTHANLDSIEFLKNLMKLKVLNLDNNKISNIAVLSDKTHLERLFLVDNSISDISQLNLLSNLISFDISSQQVGLVNVDTIKYFVNLKRLNISANPIISLAFLDPLLSLERLTSNNTRIANLPPAFLKLKQLKYLDLSYSKITSLDNLKELSSLLNLNLAYNCITKVEPLAGLTTIQELDLSQNNIDDFSALSSLINAVIQQGQQRDKDYCH